MRLVRTQGKSYRWNLIDGPFYAGSEGTGIQGGHRAVGSVIDARDDYVWKLAFWKALVDAYLDAVHRCAVECVFTIARLVLDLLQVQGGVHGQGCGLSGLRVQGGHYSDIAVLGHDSGQYVDALSLDSVIVCNKDFSGRSHIVKYCPQI